MNRQVEYLGRKSPSSQVTVRSPDIQTNIHRTNCSPWTTQHTQLDFQSSQGSTTAQSTPYRSVFVTKLLLAPCRQHQSYDDCLEVRRENIHNCYVLCWCCVPQLCTMIRTQLCEQFLIFNAGFGLGFVFVRLFRFSISRVFVLKPTCFTNPTPRSLTSSSRTAFTDYCLDRFF